MRTALAVPAPAASRGLLDILYHRDGDRLVFVCTTAPVDGDWLDIPFELWKQWSFVQLLLRPAADAPRAELVLSDLRGRYLRDLAGQPRPLHAVGALIQRLEFADDARGMAFRIAARIGDTPGDLNVFMGLTHHGSLPALATQPLRPPPARAGAGEPPALRAG